MKPSISGYSGPSPPPKDSAGYTYGARGLDEQSVGGSLSSRAPYSAPQFGAVMAKCLSEPILPDEEEEKEEESAPILAQEAEIDVVDDLLRKWTTVVV